MNQTPPAERRTDVRPLLFRVFFFGAFGFLLYQLLRIVSPFMQAIVIAVTLALVFYPLHEKFLRWMRGRRNLAAGASVAALFFIVVVPTVFFIGLLGQQAAKLYPWAQEQVSQMRLDPHGAIEKRLPAPLKRLWTEGQVLVEKAGLNPREAILRAVEALGKHASSLGASFLKNALLLLFQTAIMIFALFFLFRDGARLATLVVGLIPMEAIHKTHILNRLNETLTAVVRGMFITASVQGVLAGVGFALIGINFSVVLGFATALLALIPLIGAAAIWLPVGVGLFLGGEATRGLFVLGYGALIVSSVDNLLRPFIVGSRAKLPIALLFFGTLGGLQVYGPIGLMIGPLVVASVLAFAKIYAEQLARTGPKALLEPSTPPTPPAKT